MSDEQKGEWKLLKVWECHKCKTLIRDGRKVYEHECDGKEKVVEKVVEKIVERIVYVGAPTETVQQQMEVPAETLRQQMEVPESAESPIKDSIESPESPIKDSIESPEDSIELPASPIKAMGAINGDSDNDIKIDNDIENINIDNEINPSDNNDINTNIDLGEDKKMCLDIWKEEYGIKDSKDIGYRNDLEIEVFERGKGKKRIIIKSGRVHKKPEGLEIIGKKSHNGFIVQGVIKKI